MTDPQKTDQQDQQAGQQAGQDAGQDAGNAGAQRDDTSSEDNTSSTGGQ